MASQVRILPRAFHIKKSGANPMKTNYEKIIPTALAVAKSRAFSDISFAREISGALEKIGTKKLSHSNDLNLKEVAPTFEARYKLVNKLLLESRQKQVLEIASGLSPRGISFASQSSIQYVEMDLPQAISLKKGVLEKIVKKLPSNLYLEPGNALSLKDLKAATKHFESDNEIAIINEGLLRYLNFDEKAIVAKNIRSLLKSFGGVWITPDITLKAGLAKENNSISIVKTIKNATGIDLNQNAFENQAAAKAFFASFGFKVEVHSFLEVEGELTSPKKLKISRGKVREMIGQWVVFVMTL